RADRPSEEQRYHDLGPPAAEELERNADHGRSDRRAKEHRHRIDGMPVRHLHVEAQVRVEVAARQNGKPAALDRVEPECDREHDERTTARRDSRLEAREGRTNPSLWLGVGGDVAHDSSGYSRHPRGPRTAATA